MPEEIELCGAVDCMGLRCQKPAGHTDHIHEAFDEIDINGNDVQVRVMWLHAPEECANEE